LQNELSLLIEQLLLMRKAELLLINAQIMNKDKNWYAVYTRPRWEKRVADRLCEKNISTYCPLNRVIRQWHDRKKMILEPLFKSYVFVQIDLKDRLSVLQTLGIVNFVNWLGRPAVIRDDEIELIKRFLQEHKNVTIENDPLHINDTVRIVAGALISQEGRVVEVKRKTVKLVIPSLKVALCAEVDKTAVVKTTAEG
jgi:transcription antitermination factor NusG